MQPCFDDFLEADLLVVNRLNNARSATTRAHAHTAKELRSANNSVGMHPITTPDHYTRSPHHIATLLSDSSRQNQQGHDQIHHLGVFRAAIWAERLATTFICRAACWWVEFTCKHAECTTIN